VVRSGTTLRIFGRDMSVVSSFELPTFYGYIAASEKFVYAACDSERITSLTHDGTEVGIWEDPNKLIDRPVLAPNGLLYCVMCDTVDDTQDEIVALDAQTLQPRYRFGQSLLKDAREMEVVGEELFICDSGNDRLQVFSLAGEHRRSITGEWKRPTGLCFVKDRLYLVEKYGPPVPYEFYDEDEDEDGELVDPLCGRRIFVLSLQGDTLQVYTHPVEGQHFDEVLCCFDGTLLVPVLDDEKVAQGLVAMLGV